MTVKIEHVAGEPFLIAAYSDPLDAVLDTQLTNNAAEELAQEIPSGPIYVIADLTQAHITFSVLIQGLGQASRGQSATLKNPRIKTLLVGSGAMIDFAVSAAKQAQYGSAQGAIFNSLDAAIEFVRSRSTETA